MALAKGPFNINWGGSTLKDVEDIETKVEQKSDDYETVQGNTYTVESTIKADVTLTLLSTDVASLAVVLPQYYVAQNGTLSTGQTVTDINGAIDWKAASCGTSPTYKNLDVQSCGNPGQTFRLVNARTVIDSIDNDGKVQKVKIKFIGEPASGQGNVQFFATGGVNPIS